MKDVYGSLQRLRAHARQEAHQELEAARRARDEAQAQIDALHEGLDRAREGVDPADPDSLQGWQTWRVREAIRERREQARLAQRSREAEKKWVNHAAAVRAQLTLDTLVEHIEEREADENRKADARRMDDLALTRRTP